MDYLVRQFILQVLTLDGKQACPWEVECNRNSLTYFG
jgi:hypothetical protein